jgi:antitoxin VapB
MEIMEASVAQYILQVYTKVEVVMPKTAKLFTNGNSQAVRLPREFRFQGDEVRIRKQGDAVILEPVVTDVKAWLAEIQRHPLSMDFMAEGREQPPSPERKGFD